MGGMLLQLKYNLQYFITVTFALKTQRNQPFPRFLPAQNFEN
jgi:hypothetical protein